MLPRFALAVMFMVRPRCRRPVTHASPTCSIPASAKLFEPERVVLEQDPEIDAIGHAQLDRAGVRGHVDPVIDVAGSVTLSEPAFTLASSEPTSSGVAEVERRAPGVDRDLHPVEAHAVEGADRGARVHRQVEARPRVTGQLDRPLVAAAVTEPDPALSGTGLDGQPVVALA